MNKVIKNLSRKNLNQMLTAVLPLWVIAFSVLTPMSWAGKDSSARRVEQIDSHQISTPQSSTCHNQLFQNNTQGKEHLEQFQKFVALVKQALQIAKEKYTQTLAEANGFKRSNPNLRSKL